MKANSNQFNREPRASPHAVRREAAPARARGSRLDGVWLKVIMCLVCSGLPGSPSLLDHDPARLLARLAVRRDVDPAVLLCCVSHADVPAGGLDSRKLRQQAAQASALELGTTRERDVF